MNSMTGYGKGIAEKDNLKITIEFKSVNHRFLDINFKLPRGFSMFEDMIRKVISKYFSRGHLDVYCNVEDNRTEKENIELDKGIANQYLRIAKELELMGYINNLSVEGALKIPELIKVAAKDDEEALAVLVSEASEKAAIALAKMRADEGLNLKSDIMDKLCIIENNLNTIIERAPGVHSQYKDKLEMRIKELLGQIQYDETKLLNEVAFFVDKSNIDEEITRLKIHIKHYRSILSEDGIIGKKLDFLTQESNREVNTIGSKSNDIELTNIVLLTKNEIEKIREQIQNIE